MATDQDTTDKQRALAIVGGHTRELLANLLRVMRGAGKPYLIEGQIYDMATAMADYRKANGNGPSSFEISREINLTALQLRFRPDIINDDRQLSPDRDFQDGMEQILSGAMQVIASRLLNQSSQRAAGRREIMDGFYQIEAYREANRRRIQR